MKKTATIQTRWDAFVVEEFNDICIEDIIKCQKAIQLGANKE